LLPWLYLRHKRHSLSAQPQTGTVRVYRSSVYLKTGVLVAKQAARYVIQLRIAGQRQSLDAAQVVKDGGRKSAKTVLGERHVTHGFETTEDLAWQPGDVGPGQVERQKPVADANERFRTDSLAEVVSLEIQLHHLNKTGHFTHIPAYAENGALGR